VVSVYTANFYREHGSWSIEMKAMRQDIKTVDGKLEKVDHKVEKFEHGAKEALTELSERLDDVEEDLKEHRKEVKSVQSQVESLQRGIENGSARQINALRIHLRDSIEPIYAPALVAGKYTFALSPDFPRTIADCWRLLTDITLRFPTTKDPANESRRLTTALAHALVRLAKHYSVTDWERWQRGSSDDTERTDYVSIEDAVAAHPYQCWKILVTKWGLQHIGLERPRKQPVETDDGSSELRKVRLRRTSGSDICESVIFRNNAGEIIRQDQITRLRPPQPVPSESDISCVYEKYAGVPGRMSFESAVLGWDTNMASEPSPRSGNSHHS
jgi:hypothetical protein